MTEKLVIQQSRMDYDAILLDVLNYMKTHGAWKDSSDSRVGQILANVVAGLTSFSSAGLAIAQRESFITTARRQTSIFAAAEFLGVRITRKLPAAVSVVLSRQGSADETLSIPAYTGFMVNNRAFFNRTPIVFQPGVVQLNMIDQLQLFQGVVQTVRNIQLDELPGFRKVRLGRPGFVISDIDLGVKINGEWWTRTEDGLFRYGSTDKVFQDTTVRTGDAAIIFGNGELGTYVTNTDQLEVRYVETDGTDGNYGQAPLQIQCSTFPQVKGVTIGSVTGGANEKDSEYYRFMAPYIARTKNRAVTPDEHSAICLSYPGVADCLVLYQRQVNPSDIRWMNTIRMILLPTYSDAMPVEQKQAFETWFRQRSWANLTLDLTQDPEVVGVDVVVNVFGKDSADLAALKVSITNNIERLFTKSFGVLGKSLSTTDIIRACTIDPDTKQELPGIENVTLLSPTSDVELLKDWQFCKLTRLVVNMKPSMRRTYNGNS